MSLHLHRLTLHGLQSGLDEHGSTPLDVCVLVGSAHTLLEFENASWHIPPMPLCVM